MNDLGISKAAAEARAVAEANANVEAEARAAAEKAAAEKVILRNMLPPSEDRAVGKNVAYALLDNTGLQQSSLICFFFAYSYVCIHTYIYKCIYSYIYIYIHVCVCVYIYIYIVHSRFLLTYLGLQWMAAKLKLLEGLGGDIKTRILDVQRGAGGEIGVHFTKPADKNTIPWVISVVQNEGAALKAGVLRSS
jgi:hypothetical protein